MNNHRRLDPNIGTQIAIEIYTERRRAHTKHSANGNSREDTTWDNAEWLPILIEEIGEVAHEMTYDTGTSPFEKLVNMRKELIQVAAMATSWIIAIDETLESRKMEKYLGSSTYGKDTTA